MASDCLVVKVGGSLLLQLPALAKSLHRSQRPILIVPGGGVFADSVRNLGLYDKTAEHWMAVAAMDQYGWLISTHGFPVTEEMAIPPYSSVFLPYCALRQADPLPHSWDVTSDTIAAWVAGSLGLDLLLLKSVDGIIVHDTVQKTVSENIETESVDPLFIDYVLHHNIRTTVMNGSKFDDLEKFLSGKKGIGTVIGTTF